MINQVSITENRKKLDLESMWDNVMWNEGD